MEIGYIESEILKKAYCKLHEACHNITCLSQFLKKEYPERATIEYTVLLNGLLRKQEIESIMCMEVKYPVLGKEIEMVDKDKLKDLFKTTLGLDVYCYIDYDKTDLEGCVDSIFPLYECHF